jgi:translation initiation factor 4G
MSKSIAKSNQSIPGYNCPPRILSIRQKDHDVGVHVYWPLSAFVRDGLLFVEAEAYLGCGTYECHGPYAFPKEYDLAGHVTSLLNKLTVENFAPILKQFLALNIKSVADFEVLAELVFRKAIREKYLGHVYAKLCSCLSEKSSIFQEQFIQVAEDADGSWRWRDADDGDWNSGFDDNEKAETAALAKTNFAHIIIKKCEADFSKSDEKRYECLANLKDLYSFRKEERPLQKVKRLNKRKQIKSEMIGNICFIGELYKENLVSSEMVHLCIDKLLEHPTDGENLERLCQLVTTVGKKMSYPPNIVGLNEEMKTALQKRWESDCKAFDDYMKRFAIISKNKEKIEPKMRFAIMDVLDLQKNNWEPRKPNVLLAKSKRQIMRDFLRDKSQTF